MCSQEFRTAIDLVIHISKEHHEQGEERDAHLQSTPKSDKEVKNLTLYLISQCWMIICGGQKRKNKKTKTKTGFVNTGGKDL